MFKGQIKQLYPGQLAEVQIGSHKLMAKLEVPMKAGDAYYFQVRAIEPELQLKIISGPIQAKDGQSMQLKNLMESMQLPNTKEMQNILAHFIKNKIPFTRENLIDAEKLVKLVPSASREEAVHMIQKLMELRLPLTAQHFTSLMSVQMKEGFHHLFSALQGALLEEVGGQIATKQSILSNLETLSDLTKKAMENTLIHQTVAKLLDEAVPQQERFQLLQLMKSVGILPKQASLANLQTLLKRSLIEDTESLIQIQNRQTGTISMQNSNNGQPLIKNWQSILGHANLQNSNEVLQLIRQMMNTIQNDTVLQQSQKQQMLTLLDSIEKLPLSEIQSSPISDQLTKLLVKHLAEQFQRQPVETLNRDGLYKILGANDPEIRSLFSQRIAQLNVPITNELIQEAHATVSTAIDGKTMKIMMQSVMTTLGVNYEATIGHQKGEFLKSTEWLKPQLIALLQDPSISSKTRDAAEMIVTRMNGQLFHSGEVGVNQQIVMQLPMTLLGQRIDATLQWNGRMKEDGKIDPEFARIMFYLDLSSIEKTVVDMQVQNRIVTLTIYNENEQLKRIGDLFKEQLKEGLETSNYILSGVSFKQFAESTETAIRQQEVTQEHQGVDFRI